MRPEIVLATTNRHKIEEIRAISTLTGKIRFITPDELPAFPTTIAETGTTLEENAFLKAMTVFETTGFACLADDSGLEVDALSGAPGVHSARYAGEKTNETQNRNKLLSGLIGIPENQRLARFRTVLCYMDPLRTLFFEGTVLGRITTEERGTSGFGYDSLFIPTGSERTFAQMNADEKNALSHRYEALKQFFSVILHYWN